MDRKSRALSSGFGGISVLAMAALFAGSAIAGPQEVSGPGVDPVGWTDFRDASLPAAGSVCTVACTRGLVGRVDPPAGVAAEWVVSAHDLVLTVDSRIPVTVATPRTPGTPPEPAVTVNGGIFQTYDQPLDTFDNDTGDVVDTDFDSTTIADFGIVMSF